MIYVKINAFIVLIPVTNIPELGKAAGVIGKFDLFHNDDKLLISTLSGYSCVRQAIYLFLRIYHVVNCICE